MKRTHVFGIVLAPAALLLASPGFAAAPEGLSFSDWEAASGLITLRPDGEGGSGCTPPACVVLLREAGMLQARMRANDDPEAMGYFYTVTTEADFTGNALSATYRNESFVEAANGGFPVSALTFVEFEDGDFMQTRLNSGALQDTANFEPALEVYQKTTLENLGSLDFWFEKQRFSGTDYATAANGGSSLRVDYTVSQPIGTVRGTPFTIRQVSGFYTQDPGTLELVDGQSIDFNAGDHIGVVFGAGLLWHLGAHHSGGTNANRHFEVQSINNYTAGESANWTNGGSTVDNTGIGHVSFVAAWADAYADNANLWNDAFGTAPNADATSGSFINLQADPFPDAPWN